VQISRSTDDRVTYPVDNRNTYSKHDRDTYLKESQILVPWMAGKFYPMDERNIVLGAKVASLLCSRLAFY
jgi:hypothetical protein